MNQTCRDPFTIDAEWMTLALEDSGVAKGATVTELQFEGFIGTGQMGRNARYRLTWDDPSGRPESVVGKFPAEDPAVRSSAFETGSYVKEWIFYSRLADTMDVRAPQALVARFDEDPPDFTLIMEDLDGSAQGDQLRGLSIGEAGLAVDQAVKFHAPHWGNDGLQETLQETVEELAAKLSAYYNATLAGCLERIGHDLDDDMVTLIHDLAPVIDKWWLGSTTPRTLTHNDYRPDNFLFSDAPDAPPLVVVDWQTIAYGSGAVDVAYMIGGGFEPERRAVVERPLVEQYAAGLRNAGIDYAEDDCWNDYILGSLWGVALSVIAVVLAEQTERGDAMLTMMLRRHARHALDLGALELALASS